MKKSNNSIKRLVIYYRKGVSQAKKWEKKLVAWLKNNQPAIQILNSQKLPRWKKEAPQAVLVLGGDGTILEAAHRYHLWNPLIMGFNLGRVGFVASVRKEEDFLRGLKFLFQWQYRAEPRLMISATLIRKNKKVVSFNAINEIAVQHLLGIVRLKIQIEDHPLQYINGSGVLVATASGSTAYNLSAHGPIVMPDIKCFIITELLDHNIPTPSVIIKRNRRITVTVEDFRKQNRFTISKTRKKADVVLATDGYDIIPLQKGDKILIRESKYPVRFVEIEKHYFFKSIQEKFAFR